jgi:transposase InsO family protein
MTSLAHHQHVAEAMQDWLVRVGIKPIRIYLGSPWENGYNERFNGTLRYEVLNAEWFNTNKAGPDRHQPVIQAVQPHPPPSGPQHATVSARNSN